MAHPDESQRVLATAPATPEARDGKATEPRTLVLLFAAGLALTLIAYLAFAVPGSWFPSASEHYWTARELHLARGTASLNDNEWVLQAPDANAVIVLSGDANLRSTDYRAISWIAVGLPANAEVQLLWRSDYEPARLNSVRVPVESGRLRPVVMEGNPAWIGRITGIALAVRGPLVQPVRIRGAIARPMGAIEVLRDRWREWFAFEGWSGTSINTIVGGADIQDFPLTWAVACAIALAFGLYAAWQWRALRDRRRIVVAVTALTLCGWMLLDARWTAALVRQSRETARYYGGRDIEQKHVAAEDSDLYRVVQRAKQVLPSQPVRLFIAAEAHYFRGRAAYHFYPNNVYFDARADRLPPASAMRRGDWLFVYQRPGIQFDRSRNMLRWDDGQTHAAELKMVAPGAALFELM